MQLIADPPVSASPLLKVTARLCARDLVTCAYLALLGRRPDPTGLRSYSRQVAATGNLTGVLQALVASEEHWAMVFASRAPALRDSLAHGLLGHDAEPVWLAAPVPILANSPDSLGTAAGALAASDMHWGRQLKARAGDIVKVAYARLTGEQPDAATLQALSHSLSASGDIGDVLSTIAASDAHWRLQISGRYQELVHLARRALLSESANANLESTTAELLPGPHDLGALEAAMRDLATSAAVWQRGVQAHAASLVDMAFRGVLGRPADPAALRIHVPEVTDVEGLCRLIDTLSTSDEMWCRQLRHRGDALWRAVEQVVRQPVQPALRGRDAHTVDSVTTDAALADSIATLVRSDVFFDDCLSERAAATVDVIYRCLLGRPADAEGLATYTPVMCSLSGLATVLDSVGSSDEHHTFIRQQAAPAAAVALAAADGTAITTASAQALRWDAIEPIDRAFTRLVGRRATLDDFKAVLEHRQPLGGVLRRTLQDRLAQRPDLTAAKPRKILLFGAYGNGNLGDAYQAMAMRQLLMRTLGLPSESIFATCLMGDDFAFPPEQRLPCDAILDPATVNGFDALVIGGGGLLAHPHQPLTDAAWVAALDLPIVLFAIGASSQLAGDHRALLDKAWALSARDEPSLAALRSIRADAVIARDPILCVGELGSPSDEGPQAQQAAPIGATAAACPAKVQTLWILKHPSTPQDEALLDAFATYIAEQQAAAHQVVAIEPHLDQALEHWFAGRVAYITRAGDLSRRIRSSSRVVSMRFHGAVFAAIEGKPSLGCSQPKIAHLYEECSVVGQYFEQAAALIDGLSQNAVGRQDDRLSEPRYASAHLPQTNLSAAAGVLSDALKAVGCTQASRLLRSKQRKAA